MNKCLNIYTYIYIYLHSSQHPEINTLCIQRFSKVLSQNRI